MIRTTMKSLLALGSWCLSATFLTGCSTSMSPEQIRAYEQQLDAYSQDPDAPRILVQFCIPWQVEEFEIVSIDARGVPDELGKDDWQHSVWPLVRRVRAGEQLAAPGAKPNIEDIRMRREPGGEVPLVYGRDHIDKRGASPAHLALWDVTEEGQAVYQLFTRDREGDFVAASVVRAARRDPHKVLETYWFQPPRSIPSGLFTKWLDPVSAEGPEESAKNNTWWRLANGMSMDIRNPELGAPKARYTKVSFRDYPRVEAPHRRATSLGFLAMVKLDPVGTKDSLPQDRFLPNAATNIPPCQ
jgi:hypothetical protein